jgi:rRNA maturation endonuclease Nob1
MPSDVLVCVNCGRRYPLFEINALKFDNHRCPVCGRVGLRLEEKEQNAH